MVRTSAWLAPASPSASLGPSLGTFSTISLRRAGYFVPKHTEEGGDPAAVYTSPFAFCVVGTLVWLVDLFAGSRLVYVVDGDKCAVRVLAIVVFILEDMPQRR